MNKALAFLLLFTVVVFSQSCKDKTTTNDDPKLIFQFEFDSTQQRLDQIGQPASMQAGNAGQSPKFNTMSAHYIELTPGAFTQVGSGEVLYKADEVVSSETGIDFSKAVQAGQGETFFSVPLKSLKTGTYEYLRVSLAYQNYTVQLHYDTSFNYTVGGTTYPINIDTSFSTVIASFIGFNSYIKTFTLGDTSISVNGFRKQGFWGNRLKGNINVYGYNYPLNVTQTGQGASTTVVNPLANSSPIPPGSCLVTAAFDGGPLKITGAESKDVVVKVKLSINKSFEWKDNNGNGKWDPTKGEAVVDMGIRGMKPVVE
jgi:hypothetical protein